MDSTIEARAGAAAAIPSQRLRGRRRKRHRGGGEEGEAYCPDAEKGWKDGQPGKDDGIYSQGGVGQEWWGI